MNDLFRNLFAAMPLIASATVVTILSALLAGIIAMLLGIPAGFGRLSRAPLVRSISTFYVETIRGTPLLLQLLIWYYGVKILLLVLFNFNFDTTVYNMLTALNSNSLYPKDGNISGFFFAVVGLGFNYGAYIAEVIRAGILAVDPGETEAASSLGLSRFQTARLVILPQALRLMIPPLTNNLITLIQDTAFLQVVNVFDLSLRVQDSVLAVSSPSLRWAYYLVELGIYFVLCYGLALVAQRMERRSAHMLAGAH
ncbi:MAG TPA: amino acid ABC transporter permease [Ktedonobacterales bacterium]|jgi:His/Glu/Gln/Arg/opine family amino acid ABC transporter permease subunit|nr:amino acid ABC transporter permease [Ktedonobacterales bacterium]